MTVARFFLVTRLAFLFYLPRSEPLRGFFVGGRGLRRAPGPKRQKMLGRGDGVKASAACICRVAAIMRGQVRCCTMAGGTGMHGRRTERGNRRTCA